MNLKTFFLLIGIILGFLSACRINSCPHQQIAEFKEAFLKGMHKKEDEIVAVSSEAINDARLIVPELSSQHQPKLETILIHEKANHFLGSFEHLFDISSVINRHLHKVHLSFFVRPVFPTTRMRITVRGRELGSDYSSLIDSFDIRSPRSMEQLRLRIDQNVVERWMEMKSELIVISLESPEVDDFILSTTDEDSARKIPTLEFEVEVRKSRMRRTISEKSEKSQQIKCRMDDKGGVIPGQECCLGERYVNFSALNISSLISPMGARVTWCEGTCTSVSSYTPLFDKYTHKIFDKGNNGQRCCHATESDHMDILFLSDKKEIKTERLFNILATACSCA